MVAQPSKSKWRSNSPRLRRSFGRSLKKRRLVRLPSRFLKIRLTYPSEVVLHAMRSSKVLGYFAQSKFAIVASHWVKGQSYRALIVTLLDEKESVTVSCFRQIISALLNCAGTRQICRVRRHTSARSIFPGLSRRLQGHCRACGGWSRARSRRYYYCLLASARRD